MNDPPFSSIDQFNAEQQSDLSYFPYRSTQFPYQTAKIDHAFILESYRRLRINQRDQLANLRMPEELKRKVFNFKQDQKLTYQKPQLLIFNHPFRGKIVMTRKEVEIQLERERKKAEKGADAKNLNDHNPQQNFLDEMGFSSVQITEKKTKMKRQQTSKQNQNQPSNLPYHSKNPPQQSIQQITKKQKDQLKEEKTQKQKKKQQSKGKKPQQMKKIIRQNQDLLKNQPKFKSQLNKPKIKQFQDIHIIGEESRIVYNPKYIREQILSKKIGKEFRKKLEVSKKTYYNPFEDQNKVKQVDRKENDDQINEDLRKKEERRSNFDNENKNQINGNFRKKNGKVINFDEENKINKSINEISAIQQNEDCKNLSNQQSLNNELFLN